MGHIVEIHPELTEYRERVLETVAQPDIIQEGDRGELLAICTFAPRVFLSQNLIVPFREEPQGRWIITAYPARRLSVRRRILWAKPEYSS
jgi:hypothetical protein